MLLIDAISTIITGVLGTIGNILLILVTIKSKELHFKSGFILAILSACNLALLWNQQQLVLLFFFDVDGSRMWCFPENLTYVVLQTMEAYLILVTGIDRLLLVKKPTWYSTLVPCKYISLLCTPGILISTGFSVWGWMTLLEAAKPPDCWFASIPIVVAFDSFVGFCRMISCFLYLAVYYKVRAMCSKDVSSVTAKQQMAIAGSLIVRMILYTATAILQVMVRILVASQMDSIATHVYTVLNLLVFLTWSSDFYIYMWRSGQYRNAFMETIHGRRKYVGAPVTPTIRHT